MRLSFSLPASIFQDLRCGVRTLRRNPAFAAVTILSLMLGISATVAIYAVLDAVVLRPLPVKQPDRLALVQLGKAQGVSTSFSYPLFQRIRAGRNVFEDILGAAEFEACSLNAGNRPIDKPACRLVTRNYFQVLGVKPARGRFFEDGESAPVVAISDNLWNRLFGRSPDAIGSTLRVNGLPVTVGAVAPTTFFGESAGVAPDVFVPVDLLPQAVPGISWLRSERSYWLWAIGRLKPGVSPKAADAALAGFNPANMRIRTEPGAQGLDHLRRQYGAHLKLLAAAACLLLLVACANVANLLLARGVGRKKEFALRSAIGAGTWRIARQLLTESLLLALIAGGLGILLAMAGSRFLASVVSFGGQPVRLSIGPDLRILGFTLALCLLTALVFGLAPALGAGRIDLARSIGSGWQPERGRGKGLSGRALIACQSALSMVLIAGTALLAQSLGNMQNVDPGFVSKNVVTAKLTFVPTREGIERLVRTSVPLEARLKAMPGVRDAAVSSYPILSKGWQSETLTVPGRPAREGERVHANHVTSGFFETYRIRLVRGRMLAPGDGPGAPKVAVINQQLARQYFGGEDPIGRQVILDSGPWTVVGLVRDTKYHDLREDPPPQIFLPIGQANAPGICVGVRAESGVAITARQLRAALAEVDGNLGMAGERDAGGACGFHTRKGAPHSLAGRGVRRPGARPGVRGHLRNDVLFRGAADEGDRHANRARSDAGVRRGDGAAGGAEAHSGRSAYRLAAGDRRRLYSARHALRDCAGEPDSVLGGCGYDPGFGSDRGVAPRALGLKSGADGSPPVGVTVERPELRLKAHHPKAEPAIVKDAQSMGRDTRRHRRQVDPSDTLLHGRGLPCDAVMVHCRAERMQILSFLEEIRRNQNEWIIRHPELLNQSTIHLAGQ